MFIKLKPDFSRGCQLIFFSTIFVFLSIFAINEHEQKILADSTVLQTKEDLKTNITKFSNDNVKNFTDKSIISDKNPFYEGNGKILGQFGVGHIQPFNQTAEIILENGSITGIGNVTNIQSWIYPYISSISPHAFGHGVLSTKDGNMISWIGHDTNSTFGKEGQATFEGIMSFYTFGPLNKMSPFNNTKVYFVTQVHNNTNGINQITKMWKLNK